MKRCPICQSLAFDDASTCFGCLHEFGSEDYSAPPEPELEPDVDEGMASAPPSFLIQIKPERERSGQLSWTCKVDLVPA